VKYGIKNKIWIYVILICLLSREEQETWNGKVIMCVDLNAFYPSCEELRNSSLVGKSHAVIMTDQREGEINRGVVSSCSYEARKYGVRSAMPLSQATSLCPNLILLPVDISYYSQVSKKVMEILEQFADVLEQASIDEAFLDCTLKRAQIEPEDYAMKIKHAIKEKCGLQCSIGVTTTKSSAKLASDYRKPDGLTVVYPYNLTKFLEPLEVGLVAGIGPKTQERLKEMGIVTLGQLAAIDVGKLINKFGANGAWMWSVANGKDDDPVVVRGDHISLSTENTLSRHTSDKIKITKFLSELVDDIYERAQRGDYLFRTIGVKLVRADFTIETRETTFQDFQNSKESISSAINTVMDRFSFSEDQLPVRKVGIKLSNLIRGSDLTQARAVQRTIPEYF
jgi:DNA polymerase IV (archaeal DinB-like DNA polymerase)